MPGNKHASYRDQGLGRAKALIGQGAPAPPRAPGAAWCAPACAAPRSSPPSRGSGRQGPGGRPADTLAQGCGCAGRPRARRSAARAAGSAARPRRAVGRGCCCAAWRPCGAAGSPRAGRHACARGCQACACPARPAGAPSRRGWRHRGSESAACRGCPGSQSAAGVRGRQGCGCGRGRWLTLAAERQVTLQVYCLRAGRGGNRACARARARRRRRRPRAGWPWPTGWRCGSAASAAGSCCPSWPAVRPAPPVPRRCALLRALRQGSVGASPSLGAASSACRVAHQTAHNQHALAICRGAGDEASRRTLSVAVARAAARAAGPGAA